MAIILLVRHGENDLVSRRMAGRLPGVHLNEKGRSQAAELAQRLAGLPIKAIYSSPLERAWQTATPLAERLGLGVERLSWLQEVDYGEWQGRTFGQLRRRKLWQTVHQAPAEVRFPGGESLAEAQARIVDGLTDLAAANPPEALLACFTHGDMIRLAVVHYLNMGLNDIQRLSIHTASISALSLDHGRAQLLCYNQVLSIEAQLPAAHSPAAEKAA